MPAPKRLTLTLRDGLGQRAFRRALALLGMVALAFMSYWFGLHQAGQQVEPSGAERVKSPLQAGECVQQLEQCRQQTVNLVKGAEIDLAALAQTRTAVAQARSRIARLEQDVSLYRSLIDGSVRTAGVSAHSLDIIRVPGSQGQQFRYRLTLIQRAEGQVELIGFATISVSGTQDGKARSIGLAGPGGPESGGRLPLRFVYFQTLEGEFSLPEGLQPLQVRVQVEIRKGKPQKTERTFDWNVVEG